MADISLQIQRMRIIPNYNNTRSRGNLKTIIFAIYMSFAASLLFGCGQSATDAQPVNEVVSITPEIEPKKIKILATTPMVADWVNQVSGTRISVGSIVPYVVNPHSYQPGAKDVAEISETQHIFAVGLNYEEAWLTKLLDSHKEIQVVNLGDYISPIEFTGHDYDHEDEHKDSHDDDHEDGHKDGHDDEHEDEHKDSHDDEHEDEHKDSHDDDHGHGAYDPHFWFDPLRVSQAIGTISDYLSNIDPEGASYYKSRAEDYQSVLITLDKSVSERLGTIPNPNRKLITEHESLGYLGDRYDLQIFRALIPSLSTESGATPKDLVAVIDLIKEHDIKVIFLENESSEKLSDSVAEETGIRVATGLSVETLTDGQTYVDFINTNIQIIVLNLVE